MKPEKVFRIGSVSASVFLNEVDRMNDLVDEIDYVVMIRFRSR